MKRLFYFLSAIVLLSGCEKAEDVGLLNQDNIIVSGDASSTTLPEVLYAFIDEKDAQNGDSKTRTYVDTNTNKIVWHEGDAISYFIGTTHNAKYVSNEADGSEQAVFTLDEEVKGSEGNAVNKSYAVYPYNANTSVVNSNDTEVIEVNFPTTQISSSDPKTEKSFGKDSNIMVATGDIGSNELFFRNACGYLIIQLNSPQEAIQPIIQSIKLTARGGEKIAGNANITINNEGIPTVAMIDDESDSSTITINCTNGVLLTGNDKAEFWFALPPVTLSQGIRIEVDAVDADDHQLKFVKETNKAITIERNIPQPMASLNFENHYALRYTRSNGNNTSGKELTFADGAFKSGENNATIASHYFNSNLGCFVVNFEAPLTAIGEWAFKQMDITSITIPGTVTEIGNDAFYECDKLAELTLAPSPTNTPLTVGQDTKSTDEGLFAYCPLETINFNRQVIYNYECDNQEKKGIEGIFSFYDEDYRPAKTTITIGEQVKTIPMEAFAYANIEEIIIPGTVTEIGNDAFLGCVKLAELTLAPSPTNTPLKVGQDTQGDHKEGLFAYCKLVTINFNREVEYNYTYDVNDVQGKAGIFSFYDPDCRPTETTTITIGEQVRTIPKAAFAYANIEAITIPTTVTEIADFAFHKCTKLKEVTLEPSPTNTPLTVGKDTYKDGNEVKVAGLFSYCPLENINFNRQVQYSYTFDNSLGGIFSFWVANYKLELANTTTTINIGQQVTTIPAATFAYTNVESITIPATVTQIDRYAFYYCKQLEIVILGHDDPVKIPTLTDRYVFDQSMIETSGWIMVNNEAIATKLKAADNWSYYKDRIKVSSQQ